MKDERKAADERLRKEQEKVDRALQAARNSGEKDREIKDLAAQVDTLTVRYWVNLEVSLTKVYNEQCNRNAKVANFRVF